MDDQQRMALLGVFCSNLTLYSIMTVRLENIKYRSNVKEVAGSTQILSIDH